jgi:hypothetical protein
VLGECINNERVGRKPDYGKEYDEYVKERKEALKEILEGK